MAHYIATFNSASNKKVFILEGQEYIKVSRSLWQVKLWYLINLPDVSRVQPSLIINGFLGLLLIVQIPHEYMTTKVADLSE